MIFVSLVEVIPNNINININACMYVKHAPKGIHHPIDERT